VTGQYENSFFSVDADHANGQLTPFYRTKAAGTKGMTGYRPVGPVPAFSNSDPDTSEFVQDAVDGFPMFWGDDCYKV
jgi:hypothetical protein